jgi:pSer/pThr/pTyr-binding forkhead associated (FHA) protein/anti-anti-sigma regulatory factor
MATDLVVLTPGPMQGQVIPIRFSEFRIGRGEGCLLRPASPLIAPRHCALYVRGGRTVVRDYGTASGTLVNGARIKGEVELYDGDRLEVGPLAFTVRIRSAPPATPTVVVPPAPPELKAAEKPPEPKPAPAPPPKAAAAPPEGGRRLFLIPTGGKLRGVPIGVKGGLFLIGTAQECQLRPPGAGLAPRHCLVVLRDAATVFVRDLDSGELTFVNGKTLPGGGECPLQAGDRLGVGPLEFLIKFREPGLSPRDLEKWAVRSLDEEDSRGAREIDEENEIFDDHGASHDAALAAASILDAWRTSQRVPDGPLKTRTQAGVTVVRFNYAHLVDEGVVAEVANALGEELARAGPQVLLDFKLVRHLSDGAVELVRAAARRLLHAGSKVALCRVHPSLRGHLEALQGSGALPHFPDKVAALEADW